MSSYDEPKVQHKSTVQQVIDARQRALTAVSEVRQVQISTPHPNLAPASGDGKTLPVIATQAVVDYLLQLRPYRAHSDNWGINFGEIELPKRISTGSDVFDESNGNGLWLCRDPHVPIRDVSQLIQSLNSDVHYSTNHPPSNGNSAAVSPRGWTQPASGGSDTAESGTQQYTPAIASVDQHPGDTPGSDGKLKSFKLVLGPNRLLQLVELADEIAAEVDMLAEIDLPDHVASGGGAV